MIRTLTIFVFKVLLIVPVVAQQPGMQKISQDPSRQRLSAGLSLPIASFGDTHYAGVTMSYTRLSAPYQTREPYQRKKTGWLTGATLSHYLGKKENRGLVSYRYKGYTLLELNAGAAWYPTPKLDFSFRAGPGLGYYNSVFRFTLTGHILCSYNIGPKTIITPGLALIRETGSDALWVTSLQLGYLF